MEKYVFTKNLVEYTSQINFGDPWVWAHRGVFTCIVKIIKQIQPGEENAPIIECPGNYEAAGAELGQGGKIHDALSCLLSI